MSAARLLTIFRNALDAGASVVAVELEDAGLARVTVRDNGRGLGQQELGILGARHCTSKLRALADLPHLRSYGFRGEALASLVQLAESVAIRSACSPALQVTGPWLHAGLICAGT
jgi:DNA mismatch repair ATPase MutL